MLPARPRHAFRLADVLSDSRAALHGVAGPLGLPALRHVIVMVIDGLGASSLADHGGHARTLARDLGKGSIAGTVFPSTTAAALASLTTGVQPGDHGMVAYSVRDPGTGRVFNLLSGWPAGSDPEAWQPIPTVFELASADDIAVAAIGPSRFAGSHFSRAILRGAVYLGADPIEERVRRAREHAAAAGRTLSYLYLPELDTAGHKHGIASAEWVAALETADAAVARLVADLPRGTGVLVTADHGALDIPGYAHVILDPDALEGVEAVAGEPRCLQLYLAPDADAASVAEDLTRRYGDVGWAATRNEAIEAGLFGPVRDAVLPRIGDVLLGARKRVAFYTDPDDRARRMIGQHGSLSPEELGVPLVRFL